MRTSLRSVRRKIIGRDFLKMTDDKLERCGFEIGPASRLSDFAKECKEKKLRSFSSYKTKKDLEEVLAKHGVNGDGIGSIPQFSPSEYYLLSLIITNYYMCVLILSSLSKKHIHSKTMMRNYYNVCGK